mgnify:FL=1
MDSPIENITVIGAGNVGSQLCKQLHFRGYKIDAIINSGSNVSVKFLDDISSVHVDQIGNIPAESDAYLIAVRDDQYEDVIAEFPYRDKLMIHTSGSFESEKFEKITKRWGCLYPLQTISKIKEVNWENVQFFTECAQEKDYLKMSTLCKKAGFIYQYANSEKRKQLHVAAVVSNNFTYHLLSLVKTHCLKNNIDYNHLRHLIELSIENITKENPFVLQTGPAVRKDSKLIEKQLDMLKNEHELKEIYDLFTRQIIQKHHHEL